MDKSKICMIVVLAKEMLGLSGFYIQALHAHKFYNKGYATKYLF